MYYKVLQAIIATLMPRANFSISLPREMARQVDVVSKRENRTRSELVREALRTYFDRASFEARVRSLPLYTPTSAELRSLEKGRRSRNYVPLDELFRDLERPRRGARAKDRRARSKTRTRAAS